MSTEFFPPAKVVVSPDAARQLAADGVNLQPDVPVDLQPDSAGLEPIAGPGPSPIDLDATYTAAEARLTAIAAEYELAESYIQRGRGLKESLREEEKRLVRLLKSRTPRRRSAK